jgi:hypothetical protein
MAAKAHNDESCADVAGYGRDGCRGIATRDFERPAFFDTYALELLLHLLTQRRSTLRFDVRGSRDLDFGRDDGQRFVHGEEAYSLACSPGDLLDCADGRVGGS